MGLKDHGIDKPYECDQCDKCYRQYAHLHRHIENIHRKQVHHFCCELCGEEFGCKSDLRNHCETHTRSKPFKCSKCTKCYAHKKTLNAHVERVHEKKVNYQCDVCKKGFYGKDIYEKHCRVHTGERPFKCHLCSSSFKQKSYLKHH